VPSGRRHTRFSRDWSSDVCSSDLYFVPDVAYHVDKWQRGYGRAINIQGSDHHGTVARVRAGLQGLGLGIAAGFPEYVLHKMVTESGRASGRGREERAGDTAGHGRH